MSGRQPYPGTKSTIRTQAISKTTNRKRKARHHPNKSQSAEAEFQFLAVDTDTPPWFALVSLGQAQGSLPRRGLPPVASRRLGRIFHSGGKWLFAQQPIHKVFISQPGLQLPAGGELGQWEVSVPTQTKPQYPTPFA